MGNSCRSRRPPHPPLADHTGPWGGGRTNALQMQAARPHARLGGPTSEGRWRWMSPPTLVAMFRHALVLAHASGRRLPTRRKGAMPPNKGHNLHAAKPTHRDIQWLDPPNSKHKGAAQRYAMKNRTMNPRRGLLPEAGPGQRCVSKEGVFVSGGRGVRPEPTTEITDATHMSTDESRAINTAPIKQLSEGGWSAMVGLAGCLAQPRLGIHGGAPAYIQSSCKPSRREPAHASGLCLSSGSKGLSPASR